MNSRNFKYGSIVLIVALSTSGVTAAPPRFIDHSVLVASEYPCAWPEGWPLFQILHYRKIGSLSPYNIDILGLDPNTGTQMDTPPHSIPLEGSGLPYEGPAGVLFTEKIPAWQFGYTTQNRRFVMRGARHVAPDFHCHQWPFVNHCHETQSNGSDPSAWLCNTRCQQL